MKPQRSHYWLNNEREKDPETFDCQVRTVCDLYHQAIELYERGTHLVSTDEKTGIQALERKHPTKPMKPGLITLYEHEYIRHGTQTLIANLEVATGKCISPSIGPTRTEADFALHIERTIRLDPNAQWIFIVDQLNIHKSETLVRLVAEHCQLDIDLGKKRRKGILRSQKTRMAFLQDNTHRIRFVYTPKHTSWLNQIELWFSILVRRLLKHGSFSSVEDLKVHLLAFIDYFNRTLATPFKWTYKGRPLHV